MIKNPGEKWSQTVEMRTPALALCDLGQASLSLYVAQSPPL